MHWRTFVTYNAAGGILWAVIYGLLGYYAGRIFHNNFGKVEHLASTVSWILAGIVIVGVGIALLLAFVRRRRMETSAHDQAK